MAHEQTKRFKGTSYVITAAHPAAESYPWMPDDELQSLADDIAANGQHDDIELLPDGRVLDGRNRELACRVAGVVPRYLKREDEMTDDQIYIWVNGKNDKRRHLDASQRALVAARQATARSGDRNDLASREARSVTQADAAEQLDVSRSSVQRAAKVLEKAPEIATAVEQKKLDVKTAAKVADLPKRERKKVAEAPDPKKAAKLALAKVEAKKPEPEPEPQPEPEPVDEGYEFVCAVETLCREIDQIAARMKGLKASRFSHSIHIDSAAAQVEAARKTLWQGRPSHECPYCKGDISPECRACKGTGRVKRTTFDSGTAAMGGSAA